VAVEAQVAVAPVQRPAPRCAGVAQPGDGKAGPLRAGVHAPGRPALHDRQIPGPGIAFHPDPITQVPGDAPGAPAAHPLHVQIRQP
jgi:hypothetical protein